MQISQVLAGYSLGRADLLRRAMGKKKAEEMAKERVGFLEGAQRERRRREGRERHLRPDGEVRGVRLQQVALRGLRPPHRPDRLAQGPLPGRVHGGAHLERGLEHRQGGAPHRRGARSDGIEVLPPDVNESGKDFSAFPPGRAQGRRALPAAARARARAARPRAASASASARCAAWASPPSRRSSRRAQEGGPFKSLFDFASRVDARRINKKVVEALVKSGAFDFEGVPRWQLFAGIDAAFAAGAVRPGGPRLAARRASSARCRRAGRDEAALPEAGRPGRRARGRGVAGARAARLREGGARLLPHRPPARRATRRRRAATPPPPARRSRRSGTATR